MSMTFDLTVESEPITIEIGGSPSEVTIEPDPVEFVVEAAPLQVLLDPGPIEVEISPAGSPGPKGTNGTGVTDWITEVPTGTINGSNQAFFTAHAFTPGSTRVYLNGLRQTFQVNYNESGTNRLDLFFSPYPGDELIVDYIRA